MAVRSWRSGPTDRSHIFVTRRYRSGLLNFAAHSLKNSNATEHPVLRASIERTGLKGLFQYITKAGTHAQA